MAASVAVVVTLCGGCSTGPGAVKKADVESQVATQLAAQVKQPKPAVACPGNLPAKVGATISCTLTPEGSTDRYSVAVKVDSVSGSTVHFSAQVSETPIGVTTTTAAAK